MSAGMFFLFEIQWYRIVTILALTWLAAAGPMPAFAMTPATPAAAALPFGGHQPDAPHGMCTTRKGEVNADRLAFAEG